MTIPRLDLSAVLILTILVNNEIQLNNYVLKIFNYMQITPCLNTANDDSKWFVDKLMTFVFSRLTEILSLSDNWYFTMYPTRTSSQALYGEFHIPESSTQWFQVIWHRLSSNNLKSRVKLITWIKLIHLVWNVYWQNLLCTLMSRNN